MIKIFDRWTGDVLHEVLADSLRAAVLKLCAEAAAREERANLSRADLSDADLSDADLSDADLSRADLSDANLSRANLSDANLSRADLSRADLSDANLSRADLSRADLSDADLSRADLSRADLWRANLSDANLSPIRSDLFAVLDAAPAEVPALLDAVRSGRVNGSTYEGPCSCLVGTIATARGVGYTEIPGLAPDADRLAERWFLMIREGDTPATCAASALAERWIVEWQAKAPQPEAAS